ncbi:ABC transporter ATP-binding protein [Vagococcus vulneris]|uniref:ABC transporter domain-containing protein n=1 Tax=Vagococcus vulneris TaxID=1977869 RepID=A0A429ZZ48_9ENTE|nr:ABC transporter ATP-binding protein [Vagococcus vulneris]RST99273.1 hypothetical protein CBF37_04705 [Vagococcus vulneris]
MTKKIKLKNVTFKRKNHVVLRDFNASFERGTMVLLTGDSGCGKSTLLRLIAGFSSLDYTGQILIDGCSYQNLSMSEKAQKVGLVFQNPSQQFTMRTLYNEMVFALENCGIYGDNLKFRIKEAVDFSETLDILNQDLTTLSGGQKQRAALAVIVAVNPDVFLLDEPFASIDPSSRQLLINKLAKLRDLGKTIIICDHDLNNYLNVIDIRFEVGQTGLLKTELANAEEQVRLNSTKEVTNRLISGSEFCLKQGRKELISKEDFTFRDGITTLTGENGTGKSTFLRSIVQLHQYQGKLFLKESRLKRSRKLYQKISLAVQDAEKQFITLTPKEELLFSSNDKELNLKQQEAVAYLKLTEKLNSSIYHLSEGQKKMIQLICMLSLDLECLLLDEPFTGLDKRSCQYFVDWIKEKSKTQSFIIVTHRLTPLDGISHHHINLADKQFFEKVGEI